ncbi:MAG: O-antigen ligase family protein, partial [Caldilineales bacterium]|nr:O-antigen ligase family protein [Caldilineales bacterium]
VAYDRETAWPKFWAIVSSVVLYLAVLLMPRRVRLGRWRLAPLSLGFALFPLIIALYFLFTNNWTDWVGGKMPMLDGVRLWLARWHLPLPGHLMHPNVVGGFLAALLPLQVTALRHLWRGWWRLMVVLVVAFILATLVLTVSRGAWIGLAVVTGVWLLWQYDRRFLQERPLRRRLLFWLGVALWVLVLGGLAVLVIPCGTECQVAVSGRLGLWQVSRDLAGDTPLLGQGFGGYEMALSSYALMVHVGFIRHSHNFYLQLWLEQGLPAVVAFLALLALAWRQADGHHPWHVAALATLGVIAIHGVFDIPFYGGRGVQLLFVPAALIAREGGRELRPNPFLGTWRRAVGPLLVLLVLVWLLLPTTRAAFLTNLGALAQMRVELTTYRWPEWGLQDAVRRAKAAELEPAMTYYRRALALNPRQAAAHRRLGQIALSLGDYETAHRHFLAAYEAAPHQQANRYLLGESYAIAGEIERAATLWRTVNVRLWWQTDWVGPQTFRNRQYWYESIGERDKAAAIGRVIALVMSPADSSERTIDDHPSAVVHRPSSARPSHHAL